MIVWRLVLKINTKETKYKDVYSIITVRYQKARENHDMTTALIIWQRSESPSYEPQKVIKIKFGES